jgi:hypothetical protein
VFQTDSACTAAVPSSEVDTTVSQDDRFGMWGGDFVWNFLDVIIHGAATTRTDRSPNLADPADTDVTSKNLFGEVDSGSPSVAGRAALGIVRSVRRQDRQDRFEREFP